MIYKTRDGKIKGSDSLQDRFLQTVYGSRAGRMMIRPFTCPAVSKLAGWVLDRKISAVLISPFVRANNIELTGCEKQQFDSWNDFFTRRLKEGERPFSADGGDLISPCDSKLTVYRIGSDLRVPIKHTLYRTEELLRDENLAKRYEGGLLCVFRLSVEDYHRYLYIDDGYESSRRRIKGILHTVNPAANDAYPIYKENTREYSLLRSKHFGTVLMMEVGAMMVGRIVNHKQKSLVKRGEEKGYFAFGGSTVILMFEKDRVRIAQDIIENTAAGYETKVKQGETIGQAERGGL